MKQSSVKWFGYLFSFVFLIISCAGTKLTHKQVNEAYKGKPVSDILQAQAKLSYWKRICTM